MIYKNLLLQNENGILTITINRPEQLNALNISIFSELEAIFIESATNNDVKAVIITGSGEKAFAAGADIKEFSDFNEKQGTQLSENGHRIFKKIENFHKPVIAAVNGFALGGGCELAMACHLRIASENAKFGQPEVSLGVTPGYAGTQRLTHLIGKGKAMELLMTGALINANEALNLGLVNYVVPISELKTKTVELLQKIMKVSPVAVAGVIACVNAYYTEGVDGYEFEIQKFGSCFNSDDFKEGTTAFIEKRKANFTGK